MRLNEFTLSSIGMTDEEKEFTLHPLHRNKMQVASELQEDSKMSIPEIKTIPRSSRTEFAGSNAAKIDLEGFIKNRIQKIDMEDYEAKRKARLLPSSHMVFYKISDYMSIPKNSTCDFQGLMQVVVGGRKQDRHGYFIAEDQSRFLIVFNDFNSFFILSVSILIFFCQYLVIVQLFWDSSATMNDDEGESSPISLFAIILCIVYAAYIAASDFANFFPFELVGKSQYEFCRIVHKYVEDGKKPPLTFWVDALVRFIKVPVETSSLEEAYSRAETFWNVAVSVVCTLSFTSQNIFLAIVLGLTIKNANTTIEMIQNFVSLEIIVHVHETIPLIFGFIDLSPERFKKSWPSVSLFSLL